MRIPIQYSFFTPRKFWVEKRLSWLTLSTNLTRFESLVKPPSSTLLGRRVCTLKSEDFSLLGRSDSDGKGGVREGGGGGLTVWDFKVHTSMFEADFSIDFIQELKILMEFFLAFVWMKVSRDFSPPRVVFFVVGFFMSSHTWCIRMIYGSGSWCVFVVRREDEGRWWGG